MSSGSSENESRSLSRRTIPHRHHQGTAGSPRVGQNRLQRAPLVPDDLLVVFEADPEKTIQNFAEPRGRKIMPARLSITPVGGFHVALTGISFEIWHRQRILIISESDCVGCSRIAAMSHTQETPRAELDKTCQEQMRDWLL